MTRRARAFLICICVILIQRAEAAPAVAAPQAKPAPKPVAQAPPATPAQKFAPVSESERKDRAADGAAISAYRAAVVSINNLLKQKAGTSQEPALLMRLADTYQKAAQVEFRIGHASGKDLSRYHELLDQSIAPLSRMIQLYPNHPDIPGAYFRRSRAYKELSRKESAVKDLRFLIDHYPKTLDNVSASLTLGDLLVDIKDYRTAIQYLMRLDAKPYDPHYTLAQEKLGWAHFYLNEIPQALAYEERIIAHGKGKATRSKSEVAERESAFGNIALFFATGIELKDSRYTPEKALPYFMSLESGPDLGKMAVPFAYLLRSKGLDEGLENYRTQILQVKLDPLDQMEVLTVVMGHQINKKRYAPIQQTAKEMAQLWDQRKELAKDARIQGKMNKVFSEASDGLLAIFTKFRGAMGSQLKVGQKEPEGITSSDAIYPVALSLLEVYKTSLRLAPEDPPSKTKSAAPKDASRRQKIVYNMAEISFQIKDFKAATAYYRYIAERGNPAELELVADSSLKAIGSRFEQFRLEKIVPEQLSARSLLKAERKELRNDVTEWINWIRTAWATKGHKKRKQLEMFVFEANRMLYANGQLVEAVQQLLAFTQEAPESTYAIPSAALAVDTYLVSEDWVTANKLASTLVLVPAWKGNDFVKKMNDVAADTAFKLIELTYKKGEFPQALESADLYLKAYPNAKYSKDCLALAGNAALALKDKKRAMSYLSSAVSQGASIELNAITLLTSAALAEEELNFAGAADTYRKYLGLKLPGNGLSKEERIALQKKVLVYYWISGNLQNLKRVGTDALICDKNLQVECERIGLWLELHGGVLEASSTEASGWVKLALDSIKEVKEENRVYWALIAIWHGQSLTLKDRVAMSQEIISAWEKLDPLWKFDMIPYLSVAFPRSLKQARDRIRAAAPIRTGADLNNIKKRVKLIEEMEKSFDKITELPLQDVRVAAAAENANVYSDFARDLGAIPKIKGLTAEEQAQVDETIKEFKEGFEKKGKDLRKKAMELGAEVFADVGIMYPLSKAYAEDLGKEAVKMVPVPQIERVPFFSMMALDTADEFKGWATAAVLPKPGEKEELKENQAPLARLAAFKREWVIALGQKNWPKVAFLLAWGTQVKPQLLDEIRADLARGVSLTFVGAQPEAMGLLKKGLGKLSGKEKRNLLAALSIRQFASCAKSETQKTLGELADEGLEMETITPQEAHILSQAIVWSEAKVGDSFKEKLQKRATTVVTPPAPAAATTTATPAEKKGKKK